MKKLSVFIVQALAAGLVAFALIRLAGPETAPAPAVVIGNAAPASTERREAAASYNAAAKRAVASVVNVYAIQAPPKRLPGSPWSLADPDEDPRGGGGLGSGVVMSKDGYILTNNHVVEGAGAIAVALADGKPLAAKVVGTDPETDLAVLKIDAPDLEPITVGDSDAVQIGDVVLAIGNPFGVGQTVTQGIVSGTGRNRVGINTFENFIQTDASINPGNSGGALVDAAGRLIGINTAILSPSGGSLGIGFAIPVRTATDVMAQLIRDGRVARGWLGVEAQDLTPQLARSFGIKATAGAVLVRLLRGGPAERAGLRPGDVVVAVDGKAIADTRDLINSTAAIKPGVQTQLGVIRQGKDLNVRVELGRRPPIRRAGNER